MIKELKNTPMTGKIISLLVALIIADYAAFGQTKVTYSFDKKGNLVNEKIGDQYMINYRYDAEGNLYTKTINEDTYLVETGRSLKSSVEVYPNPAESYIDIRLAGKETDIHHIRLYDFSGRLVYKNKLLNKNAGSVRINITGLMEGLYMVEVFSNEKTYTAKFHKQ